MGFRIYLAVLRQEFSGTKSILPQKGTKGTKVLFVIFVPFVDCFKQI
jgi:hypothetical protein